MSDEETLFFGCPCSKGAENDEAEVRAQLVSILEVMRPKPCPFGLLRIGGFEDGAYLIPDCLDGIQACFSPGVSNRKNFEDQITNDHGIPCFMCDYSSDSEKLATPLIAGKQTFEKLWLEPEKGVDRVDIQSWVRTYYPDGCGDLILQMDIEGAEYRNILATSLETLKLFRIVVIEVHGLSELVSPEVVGSVLYPFFSKIGALFTSIHIHPNNYSEPIELKQLSISVSDVMELTFVRSDYLDAVRDRVLHPVMLPHPLDIVNSKKRRPIILGGYWRGLPSVAEHRKKNSGWRIIIPTRDSARYVAVFLMHYRALGIDPLYIVDGRSSDNTYELLIANGADAHLFHPEKAFGVTELVTAACEISQSPWLLRIDDDEFPSQAMLSFVSHYVRRDPTHEIEALWFNREWLISIGSEFVFYRSPRFIEGDTYDQQHRLYYNSGLAFDHSIHTSGVVVTGPKVSVPPQNFILHFDAVIKSTEEKMAKMLKYEAIEPGSAWSYADLYLPELFVDQDFYVFLQGVAGEFSGLINKLDKSVNASPPTLTEYEKEKVEVLAKRSPSIGAAEKTFEGHDFEH